MIKQTFIIESPVEITSANIENALESYFSTIQYKYMFTVKDAKQEERMRKLEKRVENLERLVLMNFHILAGVGAFHKEMERRFNKI